jgi:hypothetical protein
MAAAAGVDRTWRQVAAVRPLLCRCCVFSASLAAFAAAAAVAAAVAMAAGALTAAPQLP